MNAVELSLIVPFYNEVLNLEEFYDRTYCALEKLGLSYEIIFIDDGSSDNGAEIITQLSHRDPGVRLIQFYRNFGQTAAISAGIKYAQGKVIIPLDADNQNDPADIVHLLDKMKEGYGVVSGWRKDRKDAFLTRTLPSQLANFLISKVTGVHLKDYGCTLKAYQAHYLKPINLYGEMHRFIPAYARLVGAEIAEVPVRHHPRTKGESKYGLSRTFKVILDLITIKFLGAFATKPLYLFGGMGFAFLFLSVLLSGWVLVDKYVYNVFAHRNPFLLISVFLGMVGVMMIMMGLMAELLVRIYHESQGKETYHIRQMINFDRSSQLAT